ncbi:hypothetical protein Tco_1264893 [Tanacetum coccineum]
MEEIFDQMSAEVDQNTVDKQCAEIERKNLLIANENLIANCLSNQLMFAVEQSRCCSKHMTGNRTKLKNFVEKFIGIVRFGNDHFGAIMGYGDYVIGDSVISIVDYMEGLGHNLFSVGKFCDYDLEIAFRKHSSFVRDMNGVDLLKSRTDRPLVSRLRLFKTYDEESFKAQEVCGKVPREIQASFFIIMTSVDVSSGPAPHRKEKYIAYQIDHRREKKSRRENMPYPRFTKFRIKQSSSCILLVIPPKKSRGKGFHKGKKTARIPLKMLLIVSDESEPEPLIRRKTSSRRVLKKKATISVDDNTQDMFMPLDSKHSLKSIPEHARRGRLDIAISETTQKLKGIQTLTPAEQEAADVMKALKDSRRMLGRQPVTGGSDEGTGKIPGVPDESIFADAEDDNEETKSDSDDIYMYRINVRKNADTEMKDAEKTADITKETNEQPLTSSSFSVPSNYAIPEITPFIALQLRVTKLEQDMSEVKKIDHYAAVLASIQSYVPPVVDKVKQKSEKSPEEIIRIKREQKEKKQEPTYTIKSTDKDALEEFDLKSALFKFMHKNKSANRNPANYRLYHALMEALIEDENAMDKEVADTVKDHKRKHDDDDDDDDDEGPPAGSNQGKSTKRRRTRESESAKKPSTTKESSKDKDPKVGSKTGKSAPAKDPVEEPTDEVIMDEQPTKDIPISDEGHVSDPEVTDNDHMPMVPDTTTWFRPIPEEERPASPEPEWVIPPIDLPEAVNNWANAFAKAHQDPDENKLHNKIDDIGSFIRWYCRRIGKEELSKADLEGPAFMMVKGFHENSISLQFQMEECHKLLTNQIDLVNPEGHQIVPDISNPLPLGGPPGQVTIQPQFFFNKDLEYLLTGDKERNRALSISKLKAALYQDFGLEELVPSLWIESEREYDISVAYGITHWWFNRKQLYINKHSEPSDRDVIVLRRPDYNEYKISEKDFKSLHPNDFEDLNILHIQGKLDHLPKQDKVNLHNALDFMVKDFRLFKFNKGMETRKWTEDDKRRSEDFIEVIEKRLKTRRIFRSLESFVGGRLRDIYYKLISRTE